jgi:hypothetical protein
MALEIATTMNDAQRVLSEVVRARLPAEVS